MRRSTVLLGHPMVVDALRLPKVRWISDVARSAADASEGPSRSVIVLPPGLREKPIVRAVPRISRRLLVAHKFGVESSAEIDALASMKSGIQRRSAFGAHANWQSMRILNRCDAIDSDHSLDATAFLRLTFDPWLRTRTTRPFFKFSSSNGSTVPGIWPDFTSFRSNRRSSRIWRLCGAGAASGARGASGSTCTRAGRSRKSSSRNGSIARGAAVTGCAPECCSARDPTPSGVSTLWQDQS